MNTRTRDARRRARNYLRVQVSYRQHQEELAIVARVLIERDPFFAAVFSLFPIAHAAAATFAPIGSRRVK